MIVQFVLRFFGLIIQLPGKVSVDNSTRSELFATFAVIHMVEVKLTLVVRFYLTGSIGGEGGTRGCEHPREGAPGGWGWEGGGYSRER